MKSRAQLKGHPIHPVMIVFPIAFYVGTIVFDILAVLYSNLEFSITGKYLHIAGIAGAVLAAIPGIIDYNYTVPPDSSAKSRAAKHGIINVVALLLFVAALNLKYKETPQATLILVLEAIVVSLTFMAGWLGGTLVYNNQIGVHNRYANGGKWNEEYLDQAKGPWQVCKAGELKPGQMKLMHVNDKRIVIARTDQGYVGFDDQCTHKGGSLAGGTLACDTVHCPWHGSQFDVKTGKPTAGPATSAIKVYAVTEADGKVWLMAGA